MPPATTKKRAPASGQKGHSILALRAPALRTIPWLIHAFSTRQGGTSPCYGGHSLNLGFTKDDTRTRVEENRKRFLIEAGASAGHRAWPLAALQQVHSDLIHVVRSHSTAPRVGDGLVTNVPGIALAVQAADCFPIMLVDRRNRAVGVFHAGWRGTVKRIAEKGLGIMRREYGTLAQDVYAAIGPGIQKC